MRGVKAKLINHASHSATLIAVSLLLCSCANTDFRGRQAARYGVSKELLPSIEGKWQNAQSKTDGWWNYLEYFRNTSKSHADYYTDEEIAGIKKREKAYREDHPCHYTTLWEYLTREKAALDNVVELRFSGERKLLATLWDDDEKLDSRTVRFKQSKQWHELSGLDAAIPLLWYFVWGWQQNDTALGVNTNGNLCVHHIQGGVLMIGILPTIGGGGGSGGVSMFDRVGTKGEANAP